MIVVEKFGERTLWIGIVSVFLFNRNSQIYKCNAWSSPIVGGIKRRYYVVLQILPKDYPEKAVKAMIVQDYKA